MSILNLKAGEVYQTSRLSKHFLCIWANGQCDAKLVTMETGYTFLAISTEIKHSGMIKWIDTEGGHPFGELDGEREEAVRFFPDGFPWEKEEEE